MKVWGLKIKLNDLQLHPDSDYLKFLKDCGIKSTPEIMMIYYLRSHYICFICRNNIELFDKNTGEIILDKDGYPAITDDFDLYKKHFLKEHKDQDYFLYIDAHNAFISEEITWNSSSILGLLDQIIVLENYKARLKRYRGNIDPEIRFRNYADIGNTIIKIMKEWQIPIGMIPLYIGISINQVGKFTNAAYLNMKKDERPQWMKNFL